MVDNKKKKTTRASKKKSNRKELSQKGEWFKLLKEDEIGKGEAGEEFPYFHGLARLAEQAGKVSERIVKCSIDKIVSVNSNYYNLIAQVVVEVTFDDGTVWTGAADAHAGNCRQYKVHPTAMAETRALGRAYRRALGIRQVAFEEVSDVPEEEMTGEPSGAQLKLIRKFCKELDIVLLDIIKRVTTREEVTSIEHLNYAEASDALHILNELKKDQVKSKRKEKKLAPKKDE